MSFEQFVKSFKYLKVVENDNDKSSDTISGSSFKKYLNFLYFSDFLIDNIRFRPEIISLYKKMCSNIINELRNNRLILPIFDDYDKEFYLKKIYEMISKELLSSNNNLNILQLNLIDQLQTLGKSVMKKSFPKYFNKKLERLKDFITIESVICDYYNMILKDTKPFVKPVTIDEYSWCIIRALEIKLNLYEIVTAHDSNGDKIRLRKGDVLYETSTNVLYFPFSKMKFLDINEIRIYNGEGEIRRRFIIKNYSN